MVQVAVVDDEGVEFVAGFETPHLAEEAPRRLRGHPERLGQGEESPLAIPLIVQFAHLYRIDHHPEDAQVVAAADVAAESHAHALVEELPDGRDARGHVEVRGGAVGRHHLVPFHQLQLLAFGEHAVGHHGGRLSEETVTVVSVAVAGAFWF